MTDLNIIRKNELDKILVALVKTLDITKTQFENLAKSYNAVGKYLNQILYLFHITQLFHHKVHCGLAQLSNQLMKETILM